MRAARQVVAVLALLAAAGATEAGLRTVNVKEIVPGVPGWAVGTAIAFGVVVGGGFMAAQGAVRSRAASRGLGDDPGFAPTGPRSAAVQRALGGETAAFVAEEKVYKSALLKRLGAAAPLPSADTGRARARYAPCAHCTMPMRFAPGESTAKCVKCGRTSTMPVEDEDEE